MKSDIGTTYLGMSKMKRQDEHKIPITGYCYIQDKLLYGTDCKVLIWDKVNHLCLQNILFEYSIITYFS